MESLAYRAAVARALHHQLMRMLDACQHAPIRRDVRADHIVDPPQLLLVLCRQVLARGEQLLEVVGLVSGRSRKHLEMDLHVHLLERERL
eukprot:CAMPEP_0195641508 /NCGR_PEP_ID=MMETSP0815-20121206/26745_1 /TAXON_ID=97485 /ORGANISM="Prymnesium parvum, Strain Texoma1" /LENGTH=89 /DNA_ID=CAMNT_0040784299 /DNA_START=38 /DNA_END=303 /DNA_ORIENTATION=+